VFGEVVREPAFAAGTFVVGVALLVALHRLQSVLTNRLRKRHLEALYVDRADYEAPGRRQRAGYLFVEVGSVAWSPMRGDRELQVKPDEQGLDVIVSSRGFVPNAGAELILAREDKLHRFLTFKHRELSAALAQAGFQVKER
jgi:hypothetical protein